MMERRGRLSIDYAFLILSKDMNLVRTWSADAYNNYQNSAINMHHIILYLIIVYHARSAHLTRVIRSDVSIKALTTVIIIKHYNILAVGVLSLELYIGTRRLTRPIAA